VKISVIIVNYKTSEFTKNLVRNLKKYLKLENEIIVVDNSGDCNLDGVIYIYPYRNVGFARACNLGAKLAKGEYLLFLNPDVIPELDAIEKLLSFAEKKEDAGVVTGKLLNFDGSLQLSLRRFPTIMRVAFGRKSILRKIFPKSRFSREYLMYDADYEKVQEIEWSRGAVFLIKKDVFWKAGGFDERFFLFCEDVDLCYRLKKMGYKNYYYPDAIFYHKFGAVVEKDWAKAFLHHNISMYKYFKKHYGFNFFTDIFVICGLFLRLILIFLVEGGRRCITGLFS